MAKMDDEKRWRLVGETIEAVLAGTAPCPEDVAPEVVEGVGSFIAGWHPASFSAGFCERYWGMDESRARLMGPLFSSFLYLREEDKERLRAWYGAIPRA